MSYVKTSPEDVALHARYCRAMAAGIEWPFSGDGLAIAPKIHGLRETLRVLEKDIKLVGGNRLSVCGQVIAVPGCAKGAMGRKVRARHGFSKRASLCVVQRIITDDVSTLPMLRGCS